MAKLICPIQNTAFKMTNWIQKRPKITQKFGNYLGGQYRSIGYKMDHPGIDIGRVGYNTKIFAPMWGVIKLVPENKGYGLGCYLINEERGLEVLMNHMSEIYVKEGQKVKEGDVLGLTGSTGESNGPHLHLGIRNYFKGQKFNEGWLDPEEHFITWKGTLKENNHG